MTEEQELEEENKLQDLINNVRKTFDDINYELEEDDEARSIRG